MTRRFRDRVQFYRLDTTSDGYGGSTAGYASTPFLERSGQFEPMRGGESEEGGRVESSVSGTLKVRSDSGSRGITAADKAVFQGADYQIRDIINPDRRGKYLHITVERGVAV